MEVLSAPFAVSPRGANGRVDRSDGAFHIFVAEEHRGVFSRSLLLAAAASRNFGFFSVVWPPCDRTNATGLNEIKI